MHIVGWTKSPYTLSGARTWGSWFKRLWVLKNSAIGPIFCAGGVDTAEFFFLFLGGDSQPYCWLAEEAHQSLDVLRSRCQEELLADEFHPTQAQAA
jgi:hypothetical protein